MTTPNTILGYSLALRKTVSQVIQTIPPEKWDVIPKGWSNNARWHVGHLIITPQRLTHKQLHEPVAVSENYHKWFARDSSPDSWNGDKVPAMEFLLEELLPSTEALFESMIGRWTEQYSQPMHTSSGAILNTPGEALTFNIAHDGIHLGYIYALRHSLSSENSKDIQDPRKSAMP